jgi:hypothetical protein
MTRLNDRRITLGGGGAVADQPRRAAERDYGARRWRGHRSQLGASDTCVTARPGTSPAIQARTGTGRSAHTTVREIRPSSLRSTALRRRCPAAVARASWKDRAMARVRSWRWSSCAEVMLSSGQR